MNQVKGYAGLMAGVGEGTSVENRSLLVLTPPDGRGLAGTLQRSGRGIEPTDVLQSGRQRPER
jgi:hypothetical protein